LPCFPKKSFNIFEETVENVALLDHGFVVTYFEPPWYTKQSESLFIKMMIAAFLGSNGCFFLMWPFPVSVAKSFATIDYGTFFVRYEVLGIPGSL